MKHFLEGMAPLRHWSLTFAFNEVNDVAHDRTICIVVIEKIATLYYIWFIKSAVIFVVSVNDLGIENHGEKKNIIFLFLKTHLYFLDLILFDGKTHFWTTKSGGQTKYIHRQEFWVCIEKKVLGES